VQSFFGDQKKLAWSVEMVVTETIEDREDVAEGCSNQKRRNCAVQRVSFFSSFFSPSLSSRLTL